MGIRVGYVGRTGLGCGTWAARGDRRVEERAERNDYVCGAYDFRVGGASGTGIGGGALG